jgi:hypothetical protein
MSSNPETFDYATVERALAMILQIPSRDRGAFAARLRHLRNLGIPNANGPGSGKRLAYSRCHVGEMLIALLLESLGYLPRVAALATEIAAEYLAASRRIAGMYLAGFAGPRFAVLREPEIANIRRQLLVCSLINLNRALEELDHALASASVVGLRD